MEDKFLSEHIRAEDILLGAAGFAEDARLVCVERTAQGYRCMGRWSDGESFEFDSEQELDDLEVWALAILLRDQSERKCA